MYIYVAYVAVPVEASRGRQVLWNELKMVVSHHVRAENQIQVYWKNS